MILVWGIRIEYRPYRLENTDAWSIEYNPEEDTPCEAKARLGLYRINPNPKRMIYRLIESIRLVNNTPNECKYSATIWRIIIEKKKISISDPDLDQHLRTVFAEYADRSYFSNVPIIHGIKDKSRVLLSHVIEMFPECTDMPKDIALDYLRDRV